MRLQTTSDDSRHPPHPPSTTTSPSEGSGESEAIISCTSSPLCSQLRSCTPSLAPSRLQFTCWPRRPFPYRCPSRPPATSFPPPSILIGPNVCVNKVCAVQIAFCCTIKQGPGHGNLLINHHVIHGYGSVSLCLTTGLSLRLSQTSHPRASPSSQLPAHPHQQPVPTKKNKTPHRHR